MPKLTMTEFLDVVSKTAGSKATKVRQIKNKPEYHPSTDFYKPIREEIAAGHKRGGTKADLQGFVDSYPEKKKVGHFQAIVNGYVKWWGKKGVKWFAPPSSVYANGGFEISVKPEIGLEVDGKRHLIKLYFKPDPLTKPRIELAIQLMESTLRPKARPTDFMSIMDIRKSKLSISTGPSTLLEAVLSAEMKYIADLWPNL